MKILQVIPNLEIGGAQRLIENLLPLFKDNNEVLLVIFEINQSYIEKSLSKKGINIKCLNISKRSPKAIFKLRKYFKRADIIHLHLFPTHYYSVITNIGINKPLVFTEHSTFNKRRKHGVFRPIEKFVYDKISRVVSISEAVDFSLKSWLNISNSSKKNIIIENGINLSSFQQEDKRSSQEIFGKDGYPLLMIGRFTDSKDQDSVIRSLKYINNQKVYLVLVGDGCRRKEIENLIKSEGAEEKVLILGERNNIPEIIHASKIGILSSHWEGFGLSAIEMMAGGLPVVASDVEGVRQIVKGAGLLFEPGDEKDLAKKINLLVSDSRYYQEISQNCLKRAENFSINKTGEKYLSLYNSILESH